MHFGPEALRENQRPRDSAIGDGTEVNRHQDALDLVCPIAVVHGQRRALCQRPCRAMSSRNCQPSSERSRAPSTIKSLSDTALRSKAAWDCRYLSTRSIVIWSRHRARAYVDRASVGIDQSAFAARLSPRRKRACMTTNIPDEIQLAELNDPIDRTDPPASSAGTMLGPWRGVAARIMYPAAALISVSTGGRRGRSIWPQGARGQSK
jgi:hypothetical protein